MRPGRRLLAFSSAVLVAVALLGPVLVLAAPQASVSDSFDSVSYSGGSPGWSDAWVEAGDATGPGPTAGAVRVVGGVDCNLTQCIRIDTTVSVDHGLYREVDISGASSASIAFSYKRTRLITAIGTFRVQSRSSTSDSWITLQSYSLSSADSSHQLASWPIDPADITSTTQVRFVVDGVSILSSVFIDNVEITATYPATTTTTTTTSSTTTTLPITTTTIDLPITTTTITIPLPTTTTSSTSTTTLPATTTSSTSTTTSETDATLPPGDEGPGAPPPEIPIDPLTQEEVELAAQSNIAIGLTDGSDFQSFGLGVNPLTDLSVRLLSTVETISSEIVSALLLGGAIAFFAIRRIKDDGDDPLPPT